jgi:2',3'-cyclic-nucleotide 2'-phosphodiesterase (5'-nucleotidase family)
MKKRITTILTLVAIVTLLPVVLPVMAAEVQQAPEAAAAMLLAEMDTSISAWEPDRSFGGELNFYVRQPGIINGLAWFDTTVIPQGSLVHSAVLKVYPTYRTNPIPLGLAVSTVLGPWDETVTWNTAPATGEVVAQAVVEAVAETTLEDIDFQVRLDVTGVVQDWVTTPTSNFGFLLSAPVGKQVMYDFLASEFSRDEAGPPYPSLEITYAPPTPLAILHTNDFHGNLQSDSSGRGGSAYAAGVIKGIRAELGADNVLLADAGDVYFGGAPISALVMGESTIDIYNMLGYDVVAYGNHEFDKGQDVLAQRTAQSSFPWIGANIVVEGTDWDHPAWTEPYVILDKGGVKIGVIGVDTDEVPQVTLKGTTDGLIFKDMTETIIHYYDEVKAQADALIVVAHMGTEYSGPYKGLKAVAQELIDAGKPVDLIIGGHQHQALNQPLMVGDTAIVQAYYAGRYVGRANVTVYPGTKKLSVDSYSLITINNTLPADPDVAARVQYWADVVAPIMSQPVGTTNVSLVRDYNAESNAGDLVADSMLWKADQYDDGEVNGSVDIAFTNAGGLRADVLIPDGATLPYELTWGQTFSILPFANTLYLMDLTGEQVQALLDQAASLYKGILQTGGASWYWYNDCACATPTRWGAYGAMVGGEPLDPAATYRVVTNNFLAPGGDGFAAFTQGTDRWDTYYDMQVALNEYIQWYNANVGPIDQQVEGRIVQMDKLITILHTNDTHGTWQATNYSGTLEGFEYLAALIAQERAENPNTLLLDAGDTFQGNAFAQYFRNATPNPIAGGLNLLGYDAFMLGNHEFNFGPQTFATMLGQLDMPILGKANLVDDGSYGFVNDHVQEYINLDVDGVKVTIWGTTNPRVYRYELPTNIPGLTFLSALDVAATRVPEIAAAENPDLFIALNHIGYAPYGDEIDSDTLMAQQVAGLDVIVGAHSHTKVNPAVLVTSDVNPEGTLVAQAERYAIWLGKITVGLAANGEGGYDVVYREGHLLPAGSAGTDPAMTAYLQPFLAELAAYTGTQIGQTTTPIDALTAYTEETSGANLQSDAAVFELTQNSIPVDFHLSGAMSNRKVAAAATAESPVTLTINDMYTLMPYENSLLVMEMNGPQLKAVLERAYRNYYYYKYVPGRGGYSYYTTCMIDTDAGTVITYDDTYPELPNGNNVVSLVFDGTTVDFSDADTYYNVSSVNYLAAGSCNFNDDGITIWPLDQVVADTQYYVRDSVIDYITAMGTVSPQVEGRLVFQ